MKIEIKHRYTGACLFSHEQQGNSVKITVEAAIKALANLAGAYLKGADLRGANLAGAYLKGANLEGAYLKGADLRGANLRGADLEGADLEGADLRGAYLKGADLRGADLEGATYGDASLSRGVIQLLGKHWTVYVFDEHIKIGCKLHKTCEWENFSDQEIAQMDSKALEFWNENKEIILKIASNHQN